MDRMAALMAAVDALEVRESRPGGVVTYEETERTWGEVVTGDEILSEKTRRWYEVTRSVTDDTTGKVKINIKGSPKPIVRGYLDPVKVKRGKLGDAADTFQLLWSGQTKTDSAIALSAGSGPMMAAEEESDDE